MSRALLLVLAGVAVVAGCGGGGDSGDIAGPPAEPGPVDSLVLSLDSADVIIGDTTRLAVAARDAAGNEVPGVQLTYTSSDPAVATVDGTGLVTAVDFGEAEIEVAIAGEAGVRLASDEGPALPTAALQRGRSRARIFSVPRVVITPAEQTLDLGATTQYSARMTNLNDRELRNRPETRWSSSKASVAGIDVAGLATTANEGDTWITATITVGRAHEYRTSVPLHVAVCGGIFKVAEWDIAADVSWSATGTWQQNSFRISQSSNGRARLKLVAAPAGGMATWEGNVTGTTTINNSVSFPAPIVGTGVTSENKSGPIMEGPTAFVRLQVNRSTTGPGCNYNVRYGDYFSWTLDNNQGAPAQPYAGPTGIASLVGTDLGQKPSGGWRLEKTAPIPAGIFLNVPEPGDGDGDDLPPLPKSEYNPGTFLGISAVGQLGGQSLSYGVAQFHYVLIAR